MNKVINFPENLQTQDGPSRFSTQYENNNSEIKWRDTNEEIILSYNGYISNKSVNNEYNIQEIKKEEVYSHMDNNKLLEKYMGEISQNIRDLEQRNIEDKREREQRIENQRILSEERIEKRFIETMEAVREQNKLINTTIDKIDEKIDKIDNKYENLKWWILGTAIAIILSVVSMVK